MMIVVRLMMAVVVVRGNNAGYFMIYAAKK
jgi:hypothetical protein